MIFSLNLHNNKQVAVLTMESLILEKWVFVRRTDRIRGQGIYVRSRFWRGLRRGWDEWRRRRWDFGNWSRGSRGGGGRGSKQRWNRPFWGRDRHRRGGNAASSASRPSPFSNKRLNQFFPSPPPSLLLLLSFECVFWLSRVWRKREKHFISDKRRFLDFFFFLSGIPLTIV